MRGTNIIVQIAETTEKPEIVPQNEYCNIISTKKAQITKVTAGNGTILVKPRRHCDRRKYIDWRVHGRKIYRNKICSCESER